MSLESTGGRSYFFARESTSACTARPWMLIPSGTAAPAGALRACAIAALVYAIAPRLVGLTIARWAPACRTSGARNAARTTMNAAVAERPPTWMPPTVTPVGISLILGFTGCFGGRAVVVAVVVVASVVVSGAVVVASVVV